MQLPSPGPDDSMRSRPAGFTPSSHSVSAGELVPRIGNLLGIPSAAMRELEVSRALANYSLNAASREFMQTEQRLMLALVNAFVVPPNAEHSSSVAAFGRGLGQAFTLVDRLMTLSIPPATVDRFETACTKLGGRPSAVRFELRRALDILTPDLKNLDTWLALFERTAGAAISRGTMDSALRYTEDWIDRGSAAADARAALVAYLISRQLPSRRFREGLTQARGSTPTEQGDSARALLLRIASNPHTFPDVDQVAAGLRVIMREERRNSAALRDIYDTLTASRSHPASAHLFLAHLRNDSQQHNTAAYLKDCAALARAGYPTAVFYPSFPAFLIGERAYALQHLGSEAHVQRMAHGIAAFLDRLSHSQRYSSAQQIFQNLSANQALESIRDPRQAEKLGLILEGRNLPLDQRISTMSEFQRALLEIKTHSLIMVAVHTKDAAQRKAAETAIASGEVASSDNPPFSLGPSTPPSVKSHFMSQMRHGFRRMSDGYYGFWSQTYPLRRSPISQNCYFDDFAWAVGGGLKVIAARDIHRFPGRGRVLEGLRTERIFASDPGDSDRDPLYRWKKDILASFDPAAKGISANLLHPLEDAAQTNYILLRGCKGVTVPGSRAWTINGEHMSYVEFNHHFDSSGVHMAFLVPTRVLWSFVHPNTVPYAAGDPFPEMLSGPDICDEPPTIANMRRRCEQMRTRMGLLNLGTGSNYMGGYCNGPDVGSAPYHAWEQRLHNWKDAFGHSHKWHVKGDTLEVKALRTLHETAYGLLVAGSSRLDLLKIADHIYAWGQNGEIPAADAAESWRGEDDDEHQLQMGEWQREAPFVLRDVTDDAEIDLEPGALPGSGWQERTTRMLELAALWMSESRQAKVPQAQIPLLVLTPTMFHARAPISPFILDGANGLLYRRGPDGIQEPFLFDKFDGSVPDEIRSWWLDEVSPLAHSAQWVVPRLVARDIYLDQLRAFGAK